MPEDSTTVHVLRVDPGRTVVCDDCSKNFTESRDSGGILFQSKAIGPCCSDRWIAGALAHREKHFIRGECPPDQSFAEWVREIRQSPPPPKLRRTSSGAVSEITDHGDGSYTHKNVTPGEGACTWCGNPLDAEADMPSETCSACWEEMFS